MSIRSKFASLIIIAISMGETSGQDAAIAKSAKQALDAFHAKDPQPTSRKLHVIYFTPSDKEPADDWQPRVQRTMEHIRDFYSKEMDRIGFGPRTVPLDYDKDKKLVVHLVRGKLPFAGYNMQSGSAVREEARPLLAEKGIKIDQETILIFCNLTTVDDKSVRHNSPYYAGGSAKGGTAWLCDSKYIDPNLLGKREPMLKDGQYGNVSLGRYNSIFVGGTAHELGHALSLPHNRENAADRPRGTSLMGSGNHTYGQELRGEGKGSFLPLADALRLAAHPFFSGSEKDLRTPVKVAFRDWKFEPGDKSFTVRGKVDSSLPVHAIVAYLDPNGGGDYDCHTAVAPIEPDGSFTLPCRDLVANRPAQLRVLACLVNGATHQQAFNYSVTKDGQPNLDDIRVSMLPARVIVTWKGGDRAEFDEVIAKTTAGLSDKDGVVIWLNRMRETIGPPRFAAPSQVPAETKDVSLADCTWTKASVGWLKPQRHHIPHPAFFLSVNGERFARGLYAHAPAGHEYDLGGQWLKLKGAVGLQDGNSGTVVFVIKTDGKECWRSPVIKVGKLTSFDIDVKDARQLELIVENAGDGNASDWGIWIDPRLIR